VKPILPIVRRATAALALAAAGCTSAPPPAVETPQPQITPVTVTPPAVPTLNRTVPPVLGAVRPLTVPRVEERTLENGLRILVVEHHELPVVDAQLIVRTGGEADPARHTGLAGIMAQMLSEGTTTRSALQIADQEAFLGISVDAGSGWDASFVTLHAPTRVLDSAMALFADVALRPTFPQRELERIRKERLTDLLQLRDRPSAIASRAFSTLLFGQEHPYGRPLSGTEASVRNITRSDLRTFFDRYYRPNNATLVVVGDVTPDDVVRRATALFGGWKRANVPTTTVAAATPPARTTVYLIDKPGAPQSSMRLGTVGVARSTEDFFPLMVMNTVLGGAFTSRLNQNLREKHGYTYGAGSSFGMRRAPGPFLAQAEVVAAKTDSALIEFMRELKGVRENLPVDEVEKAKQYLQLGLPNEFETTSDIAGKLATLAIYDLPLDYYQSYAQRLSQVSAADVQRVAQRYVTPENLAIVIVGDRKAIEQGVRSVGIGDVEIRDIHGAKVMAKP
jgi:zinc protease